MAVATRNETEFVVTLDDFRTLARKTKHELTPPTVGYEAQNVRFNEEFGSIQKRFSRAKYSSMATLGAIRVIFADRYYKNTTSAKTLIIAYDTFLKKGSDSLGTFSNIKTGLTAALRWNSLTFKDLWYGCNGTDSPQVYDGTTVETMGVPVPTAPTLADSGVAGNPNGAYLYKVTYEIDSYQEGSASVASASITVTSKKITVTIPVSANTRVTARNIYRTVASGAVYNFVARVANNTDTTYTDNIADGSLDTTITAPTDYGVPPAFQFMCLHKSRIFGLKIAANQARVYYSDIRAGTSYPDVFPAANFFDVKKDDGEVGTAINEDNFGQLVVQKPSAVIKVNTDTDDPVGWSGFSNVLSVNGCIAPWSVAKTHVGVIYLTRYAENKKRLMVWNGQNSEPIFEELEPILSAILSTRLNDIVACYYNGSYYFSYSDPDSGNTFNDRVLIIDLISQSWVIDKKNIDCFSRWAVGTDNGELYSGTSDTTGFVYREDTNIHDLLIRYKSEIDLGTLTSNLTSGGTETAPTVSLNSGVTDDVGTKIVSTVTDIISTLTGEQDTVSPSGLYTSPVLEVNAKNLLKLYWTQTLGSFGSLQFHIRTGATIALTEAASWSGPYTTSGADISAVTADRYFQYKFRLIITGDNAASYAQVYVSRGTSPDDFVVKATLGLGVISETTIEMIYTSSWLDFSWINPLFKRRRKHFRQVKIEFERTTATGTLTFGYQLDGSSTRTDKDFSFVTYAGQDFVIYQFPFSTFGRTLKYRLYHNDDTDSLKIKAVHFLFTVEPVYEII